jgi:hypothetical protein
MRFTSPDQALGIATVHDQGHEFGQPLLAVVKDRLGNPVSGVAVTFTMSGSATSARFNPGNTLV